MRRGPWARASLPVLELIPSRNQSRPDPTPGVRPDEFSQPGPLLCWAPAPLGKAFSRGLVLGDPVVGHRDQLQLTL